MIYIMSSYMLILMISIIGPLVLSFYPPLRFYQDIRALFMSIALIVVIFGAWDVVATMRGHWYFVSEHVWDIRIFHLPIEEILFFVVIPFCCILSWELIKYSKQERRS